MSDHRERKSMNSRRSFIVGVSDASLAATTPTTGVARIFLVRCDRRCLVLSIVSCSGQRPTHVGFHGTEQSCVLTVATKSGIARALLAEPEEWNLPTI
jgi:hypothetical protein